MDTQQPQVNVPVRNVRPRLRLQSVPSTIVDGGRFGGQHIVHSPKFPGSLAFVVGGRPCTPPTSPEVRGPDAAIPVMNIAETDSEALSDTASDPDLSRDGVANVGVGGDESEVDEVLETTVSSVTGCAARSGRRGGSRHRLGRGDCQPCDTCRVSQFGSCGSGQSVQVESIRDEISAEVLAWCVPFGNQGRID